MPPPSRYGFPGLIAFFLLFLSLFNLTVSSPLPDNHVRRTFATRAADRSITQEKYEEYLRKYWTGTDKYIFYSGGAQKQVESFITANPGYNFYDTIFNAYTGDHPWFKFFDEEVDQDDAETSSKALATLASGDILVFGAIEYQTKGARSFFTREEIPILHDGLRTGRIRTINHMAKDATEASKVMATEDVDGKFTWKDGHKEGDTNASGEYGECPSGQGEPPVKRAAACDKPQPNPKSTPSPTPTPVPTPTPEPTPTQTPAPPKDPKSLQIVSELILCEGGPACDRYSWKFMEGKPGTAVDWCGSPIIPNAVQEGDAYDEPFPNGEWSMRFGGYAEDCKYKGHGEIRPDGDVGWLECPGRPAIKCIESRERLGERKDCDKWGKGCIGVAHCDWDM